jgi:hypothetical protein
MGIVFAMVVRNAMEDLHYRDLTDERVEESNQGCHNAGLTPD